MKKKDLKDILLLPLYCLKLVLSQLYVKFLGKKVRDKNIWLFSEKKTEARDNGYHFFRYVCMQHPEINAVYVIRAGQPDEKKVAAVGKTIYYDTLRHCVYYYAAKCRLCSQPHGVQPFEQISGLVGKLRFYKRPDQTHINLKHGISKDFRPSFDFRKLGFDLYIAGVKREYDYIKEKFNYPERNIALTGFCRFDALHRISPPDKVILIMPTFRQWLRTSDSAKTAASESENVAFLSSQYFKRYSELLLDEEFNTFALENEYRIIFYLHYSFQLYAPLFQRVVDGKAASVTIAFRQDYDVQELLVKAAVLVTDFSSVMFDYAYMHKPLLYYQFDEEEYREKHYPEGYFSYRHDGFGPVVTEKNEVIEYIKKLNSNGMKMESTYLKRTNDFFVPYDDNNCQRVYDAVMRLDDESN